MHYKYYTYKFISKVLFFFMMIIGFDSSSNIPKNDKAKSENIDFQENKIFSQILK